MEKKDNFIMSQKEEDSEDDNSDNDSVDSAQLLADITDVLNSSDLDFSGKKSESNITVSYLNKDRSAGKTSDKTKTKCAVIQDVEMIQKHEKAVPVKGFIASSHNDPNININSDLKFAKSMPTQKKRAPAEYVDLSCASENNQDAGPLVQETAPQALKEPFIYLTRLDPNQIFPQVQPPQNLPGSAQSLSLKAELSSGDRKARKKTEIKKSAWYDEDSPLSDISVSDVSDPEDETSEQKPKGIKDKISKGHEKNSKSNSSRHKVSEKDVVSEEKKGVGAPLSSLKPKVVHSNQNSSLSQSKKSTTSGVKISNPIERPRANEAKNTDKDRKVTEKSKTNILTDSRKRRLSKDDGGIDILSQSSLKHQKVTSAAAKKGDDLKHQGVSLFKDKNQKLSSVDTKKTMDVTQLSNWRYELHLSPVDIDDLSNESFRKFINLASDCAINFDSSPKSHHIDGHVNLYFGTAPQMQSGMQKLCQLSLIPPKILQGIIKCRHLKQVANVESDVKWMCTEEVKLGFSMFSTWTEKVKQLVQGKDWKREDETKRKFAQIQSIPPIVSKEMISLLFPFSHNVCITKSNAGDQKKDSSGKNSVEFENTAWMETMLSCFRDLYVAKSGNGNPVWKLRIMNFTPRPEKIPERPVTANQGAAAKRNLHGPKTPADSTSKDKLKDFTVLKQSDRYQAKSSKETSNARGKDECRKRPFPVLDDAASGGRGSEKKRRPSEGISGVSAFDQREGPSPQNTETDKSNLRVLAQSRGLDPNNVDVLRILEVQNQLTSLQALFSCASMEDTGSLHGGASHTRGKSQGSHKLNPERNNNLSATPNTKITEAEKQLRENIASKQRQLRELEEKLQRKRNIPKDNSQNQLDGSGISIAASLNNEPLDFTKPAPKIEEAVKKDEERSKMFASNPPTSSIFPLHSKGKRDNQKESTITAEDFALPLQFGKNVSKVAIDEITHQSDRQMHEREHNRQSTNRSDQRKSLNERRPLSKGSAKGSAFNDAWNQQRQKRNFDEGKPVEWTRQGQSKERDMLNNDRLFIFQKNEGSSESKRNLFQESFRPGQNRMHQNFGSSRNESIGSKTNTSLAETGNGRYPGPGQRSHMAHEKMWQENSYVETRQFPESGIKSDSERRRAQSVRNEELVRLNPKNEYLDEFEDADYNMGDNSVHGNRQDNTHFFRENVQPEKYNPLRKSSEPLGDSQRNQQAAPRESSSRLCERQHQEEMAQERYFGNAWKGGGRFEDVEKFEYSRERCHGTFEYIEENTDIIPQLDRDEAFDQEFGFQERSLGGRGSSLRARGIGVRGRGGMEMRGRGTEFQRGGPAGGRGTEPSRGFGMRGRGHEPQRSATAEGRDSELERRGSAGGRGTEPQRSFGMRGRGHEAQRGAAGGGRSSELGRGGAARGRGTEPTRDFGMRGRGHEPERGATVGGRGSELERGVAVGGRGAEPTRGFGMRGRGHEPERGAAVGVRGSELERGVAVGGRGAEPPRGFGMRGRGHEPQRGAAAGGRGSEPERGGAVGGRGAEPPRVFGMRGRGHEPQRGAVARGRGSELERGGAVGGRDAEPPRGFGMRGRGHEPQRGAAARGRGSELGGRGAEPPRGFGMRGTDHEPQIGVPMDDRDRNMESPLGLSSRGRGLLPLTGRSAQPQRGMASRGRGVHPQRGTETWKFEAEPQFAQNEGDSGPLFGNRIRGGGIEQQRNTEMIETGFDSQSGYGIRGRGRGILRTTGIVGEPQSSTEIEERSFEGGRGAGAKGGGMQGLRGRGMRGRGNEIHQGLDVNERNHDTREGATEILQGGPGMRGRGGQPQRGSGMGGNGRRLDSERGSMAGRGRGFQNTSSFSNVRGEQSSLEGFGCSEESFHNDGNGGESFAPIPVLRSNVPRGRGQNAEWQRGCMSQRGRSHTETHLDDRFEDFANSLGNREPSPATDYQSAGNNRGRERQSLQDGFEHRQNRMQEANSSMKRAGSADSDQRGSGRDVGFGTSPRGREMPRGRGFMGPPAPSPSNNFEGIQFHPQRGHETGGDFGGRGGFNVGQNDRRPQGRGGQPPVNFSRGGTGRNMMARGNNKNRPGMR